MFFIFFFSFILRVLFHTAALLSKQVDPASVFILIFQETRRLRVEGRH